QASGDLTINPATPALHWSNPADITYGTALGAAQLDATASSGASPVAGTFTYNPASGTNLDAGPGQTLTATFTPTDAANFTSVSVQAAINVTPVALTVSADDASKVYGQPNPTFTTTYSGFVLGQGSAALGGRLTFNTPATTASHVQARGY